MLRAQCGCSGATDGAAKESCSADAAEPRTAQRRSHVVRLEDMILVSVDDHVVEPPDVFEHHLPAKYKDIAPRIERMPDGTDRWKFLDFQIPNVGLNAVA